MTHVEQMIKTHADKAWARYVFLFKKWEIEICERPIIKLNNRLTKSAGRAFVEEHFIDLGAKFFINPLNHAYMLNNVIPHEYAHILAYKHFQCHTHGKPWKQLMLAYGIPADVYHNMKI